MWHGLLILIVGQEKFVITHPPNAHTLHYDAGTRQVNASLRYELSPGGREPEPEMRICVEVQRAAGPQTTFSWFAEGCFKLTQPITLVLPAAAAAFIVKAAIARGAHVAATAQSGFATAAAPQFEPTYEWTTVPHGASVPAGLDVQLALDGAGKLARIPDPFQLQLGLSARLGVFRTSCARSTTVGELTAQLDAHLLERLRRHPMGGDEPLCATLAMRLAGGGDGEREVELPLSLSAEELQLFRRQQRLSVRWRPCEYAAQRDVGQNGGG
jgi:hypothetical protein